MGKKCVGLPTLECTVSPRLPRYLLKFEVMACYELCIRVVKKKSCALCSLVKSGYASHLGPECFKPSTPPSRRNWPLQTPRDILQ